MTQLWLRGWVRISPRPRIALKLRRKTPDGASRTRSHSAVVPPHSIAAAALLLLAPLLHADPVGFASLDGDTTGGGNEKPVIVRTAQELQTAIERFNDHPAEFRFNEPKGFEWKDLAKPPYAYQAEPVSSVEVTVKREAGPR